MRRDRVATACWWKFLSAHHELKNELDGELDLPFGDGSPYQHAGSPAGIGWGWCQGCSGGIENVGIAVARPWRSKVRVIENVKHLDAELDVKVLRDSADVVIFEDGEIEASDAWAGQAIASGVAAQIETLR